MRNGNCRMAGDAPPITAVVSEGRLRDHTVSALMSRRTVVVAGCGADVTYPTTSSDL